MFIFLLEGIVEDCQYIRQIKEVWILYYNMIQLMNSYSINSQQKRYNTWPCLTNLVNCF